MRIKIHRGTHEIGGTCVEVYTRGTRILLDFGLPLVSVTDKKAHLDKSKFKGLDAKALVKLGLLPDIKNLYSKRGPVPVRGILISHPHMDHYGLINHVRQDVPIYLGKHAKWTISASNVFSPEKFKVGYWAPIESEEPFQIGDFNITPYCMDHSAFDSMSFLIEAGGKKLFYTGDFRAHGRKWQLFYSLPKKLPRDIDVMLMEGTVLGNPRGRLKTETEIENDILAAGLKHKGLKLIYASGQNFDRLVSFYRAAKRSGKKLVLDLYTAFMLDALRRPGMPHPHKNFPEIKILYSKPYLKLLAIGNQKYYWDYYRQFQIWPREMAKNPGDYFVMYRPGVVKELEEIGNFKDALLIYSLYEGYRKESKFAKVKAFLDKHGIRDISIHTSGHAYAKHLWFFAKQVRPKTIIPIHTFDPEAFKKLYPSVKILKDGERFRV